MLGQLKDNLIQQSLVTTVTSAGAAAYSFLMVYFGRQLTFATSQAIAATTLQETAVDGFVKSALPVALAQTLVQAYIEPAVEALQEEVNLQNQGAAVGAQLTGDLSALTADSVDASLAAKIAQEQGALVSLFALWAASDNAYQSTLVVPGKSQQQSDQQLAAQAGADAYYLMRFEQVAATLASGLASAQLTTSASAAGQATAHSGAVSVTASGAGTLTLTTYGTSAPIVQNGFAADTDFFDVAVLPGSDFSSVSIEACGIGPYSTLMWYDPSAQTWVNVEPATALQFGIPDTGCVTFHASQNTSPSIAQLTGTVFAIRHKAAARAAARHSTLARWIAVSCACLLALFLLVELGRRRRARKDQGRRGKHTFRNGMARRPERF